MANCWPINPGEQLMVIGAVLMLGPPLLTFATVGFLTLLRDV